MSAKKAAPVWIYGINAVLAMIELAPEKIARIRIAQDSNNSRLSSLRQAAEARGIHYDVKPAQSLHQTVGDHAHQGVAALCSLPEYLGEHDLARLCADTAVFLVLDRVTDPVNLGACLRNAGAFGATAVVVPAGHTAQLTPAAVKVASGAVGRTPIVRVGNLSRAILSMKKSGVWMIGTFADAGQPLCKTDCRRPVAFVLGAEDKGLRRRISVLCDYRVSIPLPGKVESLNVSMASAICLYEMRRQRLHQPP